METNALLYTTGCHILKSVGNEQIKNSGRDMGTVIWPDGPDGKNKW